MTYLRESYIPNMASAFPDESQYADDSYSVTTFEEEGTPPHTFQISAEAQRRLSSMGREFGEDGEEFRGFNIDDQPSQRVLSVIAPPSERGHRRMLVSDSRNDPNWTGGTVKMYPVESQFITVPPSNSVPGMEPPLTSTLRSQAPPRPNVLNRLISAAQPPIPTAEVRGLQPENTDIGNFQQNCPTQTRRQLQHNNLSVGNTQQNCPTQTRGQLQPNNRSAGRSQVTVRPRMTQHNLILNEQNDIIPEYNTSANVNNSPHNLQTDTNKQMYSNLNKSFSHEEDESNPNYGLIGQNRLQNLRRNTTGGRKQGFTQYNFNPVNKDSKISGPSTNIINLPASGHGGGQYYAPDHPKPDSGVTRQNGPNYPIPDGSNFPTSGHSNRGQNAPCYPASGHGVTGQNEPRFQMPEDDMGQNNFPTYPAPNGNTMVHNAPNYPESNQRVSEQNINTNYPVQNHINAQQDNIGHHHSSQDGDHNRGIINRRLETETKVHLHRLGRTVNFVQTDIINVREALNQTHLDYNLICSLTAELKGHLSLTKRLRDSAAPYINLCTSLDLAETLFEIELRIPEWEGCLSLATATIQKMERNSMQITSQNATRKKAVKVSTSEFPKFDGIINYFDWWAKWTYLATASQLDEDNLTIKLKESLVDNAEEIIGSSLMSTGTFQEIKEKLESVYDQPILRMQQATKEFFNIKIEGDTVMDARKMMTEGSDALRRAMKAGLTLETLMSNLLLMKLPEKIREKMIVELNQTCPFYNITEKQLNNAFYTASSTSGSEKGSSIGAYQQQTVTKSGNGKGSYKGSYQQQPYKYQIKCLLHSRYTHPYDIPCNIEPTETRRRLQYEQRCLCCGWGKRRHIEEGGCKYVSCQHHPKENHHTSTCDGKDFSHPGCQFDLSNKTPNSGVS